jgi:hypothetical protein
VSWSVYSPNPVSAQNCCKIKIDVKRFFDQPVTQLDRYSPSPHSRGNYPIGEADFQKPIIGMKI